MKRGGATQIPAEAQCCLPSTDSSNKAPCNLSDSANGPMTSLLAEATGPRTNDKGRVAESDGINFEDTNLFVLKLNRRMPDTSP